MKTKHYLGKSLLLTALWLLSTFPAWAQTTISTPDELIAAANDRFKDGNYKLTADIDLKGKEYPKISSLPDNQLKKLVIDGDNHTISNLNQPFIFSAGGGSGTTQVLEFKNLTIDNANIVSTSSTGEGDKYVGAFIGLLSCVKSATFVNCKVTNSTIQGISYVGGFTGWIYGLDSGTELTVAEFTNCEVSGNQITGAGSTGGFVGQVGNAEPTKVVLTNPTVKGNTITCTDNNSHKAGTLFGTVNFAGNKGVNNNNVKMPKIGGIYVGGETNMTGNTIKSNNTPIPDGQQTGRIAKNSRLYTESADGKPGLFIGSSVDDNTLGTFTPAVAQIGVTYYTTIDDAVNASKDGDDIIVFEDAQVTVDNLPDGVNILAVGDYNKGKVVDNTPRVAQVGDRKYNTLPAAFAAAASGSTITLLKDAEGSGVAIKTKGGKENTKELTLDLDGHTYTMNGNVVGSTGYETQAFHFEKGSTITIKNGRLTATKGSLLIQNYCDLTLEDVTLDESEHSYINYVVSNNNGSLTTTGKTVIKAAPGKTAFDVYYWPKNGYTEGVTVKIGDGTTLSGNIEYGSDGTTKGDWSDKAKIELGDQVDISNIKVVASSNENVEPNIKRATSTEPLYTVLAGKVYYPTLQDAVNAAATDKSETKITVLNDTKGAGVKVVAGKNLVIDLNGKTYEVTNPTVGSTGTETNGFQLLRDSKVTFKNGTLTSSSAKFLIQNYCDLTLDGVTVDGSKLQGSKLTVSNNFGSLTTKGNTRIIAAEDGRAFDIYYWPDGGYANGVSVNIGDETTVDGKIEYGASDKGFAETGWEQKAVLRIDGGTFKNFQIALTNSEETAAKANINISGGTFDNAVEQSYCVAGYKPEKDTEGMYTVKEDATAAVNYIYYTTEKDGKKTYLTSGDETATLSLTDGDYYSFVVPKDVTVAGVKYTRNFTNTSWNASYLPFDIKAPATGVTFYELRGVLLDESNNWFIAAYPVKEGATVKANVPYLVKPAAEGETTVADLQEATLYSTTSTERPAKKLTITSSTDTYTFTGVYTTKTTDDGTGWYALAADGTGFTKTISDEQVLKPLRFSLEITERDDNVYGDNSTPSVSGAAKINIIDLSDQTETTGISEVYEVHKTQHNVLYDLQGRRVTQPVKGSIYIMNGKKLMAK